MCDSFISNLSKYCSFWLMLCFWISCEKQKHYEPVIITEELLCELQEKFNLISIGPGRPCQQFVEIEYYWFRYYGGQSDSNVSKDQVLRVRDRYRIKYNKEQRTNREWYVEFEKYLFEMETYGIKCIFIFDLNPENDDRFVFHDMPCVKYAHIDFYADRISLSAYPTLDTIDLSQYESVRFSTHPFIKDTAKSINRLPGTFWGYDFVKKPDKNKK